MTGCSVLYNGMNFYYFNCSGKFLSVKEWLIKLFMNSKLVCITQKIVARIALLEDDFLTFRLIIYFFLSSFDPKINLNVSGINPT